MAVCDLPLHVRVSAPAKVLLFGEHAVVYGCSSIAVALSDLRLTVTIDRLEGQQDAVIEFVFDDIPAQSDSASGDTKDTVLRKRYPIDVLRRIIHDDANDDASYVPRPKQVVLERVDKLLESEHLDHANPLRPAIFLSCALLHASPWMTGNHGSLCVRVSAGNFPIGAGLGSSAAFSVALAGALSHFRPDLDTDSEDDADKKREVVNRFAYSSEIILHGSPSGVDNTVSVYGGALQFRKLPAPSFDRISFDMSKFRFLIVNTRVPRSTKEQVANVRCRYDANRTTTQLAFDTIEAIIQEFMRLGEHGELTELLLGDQMAKNHAILNDLGVGHPRIEEVVAICQERGMATKLTGAGGGGCTVSLVPQSLTESEVAVLVEQLTSNGFQCFLSAIGGSGVTTETIF